MKNYDKMINLELSKLIINKELFFIKICIILSLLFVIMIMCICLLFQIIIIKWEEINRLRINYKKIKLNMFDYAMLKYKKYHLNSPINNKLFKLCISRDQFNLKNITNNGLGLWNKY